MAGDVIGNLFFAAHVVVAVVLTFGGTLQLVPQIRKYALAFHRWNGRLFMIAAFAAALGGLYLEWVRGTGLRAPTGIPNAIAVTLNAVLILAFTWLAWRAVRGKPHRLAPALGDAPLSRRERHVVHARRFLCMDGVDRRRLRRAAVLQLLGVWRFSSSPGRLRTVRARQDRDRAIRRGGEPRRADTDHVRGRGGNLYSRLGDRKLLYDGAARRICQSDQVMNSNGAGLDAHAYCQRGAPEHHEIFACSHVRVEPVVLDMALVAHILPDLSFARGTRVLHNWSLGSWHIDRLENNERACPHPHCGR